MLQRLWLDLQCHAVTLPTLPILFVQGRQARRRTPRLSEAGEPFCGRIAGRLPTIRLIMLGESPVAGVGVAHHAEGLSGQTAQALHDRTQRAVAWEAIGKNGMTARGCQRQLMPCLVGKQADILVMALGVNDVTGLHSPSRWQTDLRQLIMAARELLGDIPLIVAGVPPLGRFPAIPQPTRSILGMRANALDGAARLLAQQMANVTHCPTPPPPATMFARDGYHPGPLGCTHWGRVLAETMVNVI